MAQGLPAEIRALCAALAISQECETLLRCGLPAGDLLSTLQRLHAWSFSPSKRRWNLFREIVNTIRRESNFLNSFLSVDLAARKKCLDTLQLLYEMTSLNYRDRLILLTKYILAQINPLGNSELREQAEQMVRKFIRHKNPEVRNATFRGITFEVARLRQKGGSWYIQPLIDMLVDVLREDAESREYIRAESMEVYYTQEQRDVVDDILVAVALRPPVAKGEDTP